MTTATQRIWLSPWLSRYHRCHLKWNQYPKTFNGLCTQHSSHSLAHFASSFFFSVVSSIYFFHLLALLSFTLTMARNELSIDLFHICRTDFGALPKAKQKKNLTQTYVTNTHSLLFTIVSVVNFPMQNSKHWLTYYHGLHHLINDQKFTSFTALSFPLNLSPSRALPFRLGANCLRARPPASLAQNQF